jgi:hypothetical protein
MDKGSSIATRKATTGLRHAGCKNTVQLPWKRHGVKNQSGGLQYKMAKRMSGTKYLIRTSQHNGRCSSRYIGR